MEEKSINNMQEMLRAAVELARRAVQMQPRNAGFHSNLGNALQQAQLYSEAVSAFEKAALLQPQSADPFFNLGNALQAAGRPAHAVAAYRRALKLNPDFVAAMSNLAGVLSDAGQLEEAAVLRQRAVVLQPGMAELHSNLGNSWAKLGRHAEAAKAFKQAIALKPGLVDAHRCLGDALQQLEDFEHAIAAYGRAIDIQPNHADSYVGRAAVYWRMGNAHQARLDSEWALKYRPDHPDGHWNHAMALLSLGEWPAGWEEYEWRFRCSTPSQRPRFSQPHWNGEPLNGKTVLLYTEQGFGDVIQFVRFAPEIGKRGGKTIIWCRPELVRLLAGARGVDRVVATDHTPGQFDLQCSLATLPKICNATIEKIPWEPPYITVNKELESSWEKRVGEKNDQMRIGLVWAGSPLPNPHRSIDVSLLATFAKLNGCVFFSLQKGPAASSPYPVPMESLGEHLDDFADAAAAISQMDLIISVDTSVAHLAGALGKRVWTLVPFAADWRWLVDREDSPWYPTMRLFRQRTAGDWAEVIERVSGRLQQELERRADQSGD